MGASFELLEQFSFQVVEGGNLVSARLNEIGLHNPLLNFKQH
jgi:hypothetical protein